MAMQTIGSSSTTRICCMLAPEAELFVTAVRQPPNRSARDPPLPSIKVHATQDLISRFKNRRTAGRVEPRLFQRFRQARKILPSIGTQLFSPSEIPPICPEIA